MGKQQLVAGDVLRYFADPTLRSPVPALRDIEGIELWKGLSPYVSENKKGELAALINLMLTLPSYTDAKVAAKAFGYGGLFSFGTFAVNLQKWAEAGMLVNPFGRVYGLSPELLVQLGLLDRFMGNTGTLGARDIWASLRERLAEKTMADRQSRVGR